MSTSDRQPRLEDIEQKIGHVFGSKDLLTEALTHTSYYYENRDTSASHNERLEFLGDSVIGLVVVEQLFLIEPVLEESVLAKAKSYLVSEAVLAGMAESIGLNGYVILGKGEDSTGGRRKKSILADALEAVIGAVYLDGGFEKARSVALSFFQDKIRSVVASGAFHDFKTELQELTQMRFGMLPEYRLIGQEGREHERTFTVAVFVGGTELGTASGRKIKEAEGLAARSALERLMQAGA